MFSEKIRNNLYNELNTLLDNNEFYNINTSYNKAINDGNNIDQKSSITENDKTINKDEINYKKDNLKNRRNN